MKIIIQRTIGETQTILGNAILILEAEIEYFEGS